MCMHVSMYVHACLYMILCRLEVKAGYLPFSLPYFFEAGSLLESGVHSFCSQKQACADVSGFLCGGWTSGPSSLCLHRMWFSKTEVNGGTGLFLTL